MEGMKAVHCTVCYRLVPGSSVSSGRENTEEEKGKEVKLCPLAEALGVQLENAHILELFSHPAGDTHLRKKTIH